MHRAVDVHTALAATPPWSRALGAPWQLGCQLCSKVGCMGGAAPGQPRKSCAKSEGPRRPTDGIVRAVARGWINASEGEGYGARSARLADRPCGRGRRGSGPSVLPSVRRRDAKIRRLELGQTTLAMHLARSVLNILNSTLFRAVCRSSTHQAPFGELDVSSTAASEAGSGRGGRVMLTESR